MKTQPTLLNVVRTLLVVATAAVYPSAVRAATESPSELLERGIYAQETKGDVDSAIAIYQQLVTEQNVNQSLINWSYCVHNPLNWIGYSATCWQG